MPFRASRAVAGWGERRLGGIEMKTVNHSRRSAFTMVEIVIVAAVIAILTITAWPDREAEDQTRLDSALTRLEADIEYARTLSLTTPTNPAVLKVDMANDKYWIAKQATPATPVTNPATRKPYVVQLGQNGDSGVRDVKITADNLGTDHMVVFDSRGGLNANGDLGIQFRAGSKTGSVKISAGSAATRQSAVDLVTEGLTNVVEDTLDVVGGLLGGGR